MNQPENRDYVRCEECNGLGRIQTGVSHARQDDINVLERLGNSAVRGGVSGIDTTEHKRRLQDTRALGQANNSSKLDAIVVI